MMLDTWQSARDKNAIKARFLSLAIAAEGIAVALVACALVLALYFA